MPSNALASRDGLGDFASESSRGTASTSDSREEGKKMEQMEIPQYLPVRDFENKQSEKFDWFPSLGL